MKVVSCLFCLNQTFFVFLLQVVFICLLIIILALILPYKAPQNGRFDYSLVGEKKRKRKRTVVLKASVQISCCKMLMEASLSSAVRSCPCPGWGVFSLAAPPVCIYLVYISDLAWHGNRMEQIKTSPQPSFATRQMRASFWRLYHRP